MLPFGNDLYRCTFKIWCKISSAIEKRTYLFCSRSNPEEGRSEWNCCICEYECKCTEISWERSFGTIFVSWVLTIPHFFYLNFIPKLRKYAMYKHFERHRLQCTCLWCTWQTTDHLQVDAALRKRICHANLRRPNISWKFYEFIIWMFFSYIKRNTLSFENLCPTSCAVSSLLNK